MQYFSDLNFDELDLDFLDNLESHNTFSIINPDIIKDFDNNFFNFENFSIENLKSNFFDYDIYFNYSILYSYDNFLIYDKSIIINNIHFNLAKNILSNEIFLAFDLDLTIGKKYWFDLISLNINDYFIIPSFSFIIDNKYFFLIKISNFFNYSKNFNELFNLQDHIKKKIILNLIKFNKYISKKIYLTNLNIKNFFLDFSTGDLKYLFKPSLTLNFKLTIPLFINYFHLKNSQFIITFKDIKFNNFFNIFLIIYYIIFNKYPNSFNYSFSNDPNKDIFIKILKSTY